MATSALHPSCSHSSTYS